MSTSRGKTQKEKMALRNNGNEETVVTLEWQKDRMAFLCLFKGI